MPSTDDESSADELGVINPPAGFDWRGWVDRWDRMQAKYLVHRAERFDILLRMIGHTQESVSRVLELGCGPGTLTLRLAESFPQAEIFGVDFDPTMLLLAGERLAGFGSRVCFVRADLREASWPASLPSPMDVVVSATSLHWFTREQLAALYAQIARILRPGGIFLNADHIGSASDLIQKAWERHREEMRRQEANPEADDWDGFWQAYAHVLKVDVGEIHQRLIGDWETVSDEGLPLAWHFDELRASGFEMVDCFWRCDCDAIYGGIRAAE